MATHSSVLAWRIPETEAPSGLPSMGSHRVGHDWIDLAAAAASSRWIDRDDLFYRGFPGGSDSKESACNAGDPDSIPGLRISPGERNDNPLQYSCLENPWIEEPGRLQSKGSQRVTRDRETIISLAQGIVGAGKFKIYWVGQQAGNSGKSWFCSLGQLQQSSHL